uniref:CP n=1 Tax=Phyllanthus potexvirus 1 TaxID=2794412 RepID=A0A7T5QZ41_9VIRU|nr:CP [Phyllanthus potexvirus 1]
MSNRTRRAEILGLLENAALSDEERATLQSELDNLPPAAANPLPAADPMPGVGNRPRARVGRSALTRPPPKDVVRALSYTPASNAIATADEVDAVATGWSELGVPADQLFAAAFDLARHCADIGSSGQAELVGNSEPFPTVKRTELAAIIKRECKSLRQFCAYFAKFVWNDLIRTDTPPAGWERGGFRFEERFAGFDFFHGVNHTASLTPQEGIIRAPSELETRAAATNSFVAIARATKGKSDKLTTAVEVTHGTFSGSYQAELAPP